MFTRRDFAKGIGASVIGMAMSPTWAAPPAGIRIRKDVSTLDENSSDIIALRRGVAAMRALPAADKRHWIKQAEIHGKVLGNFGQCKHGNWFFLPWHRGYLHFFEDIIRKLSGDSAFALPYWDWSRHPMLPAPFWSGTLNNPPRSGEMGSGRAIQQNSTIPAGDMDEFVGINVISSLLGTIDFESFGGRATANPALHPGQGGLERGPHNYIHTWVDGDMGTGGSPYDPIFWLHHCNVDRLWSEWMSRHPNGTPGDMGWLNRKFTEFCDDAGTGTTVVVKDVLDSTKLGYQYDTQTMEVAAGAPAISDLVGPLSMSDTSIQAGPQAAFFSLAGDSDRATDLNRIAKGANSSKNQTVRVTLQGIKIPPSQNCALRVFINCKLLSPETPITDPSYAGSCTFFNHTGEHAGHGDGTAAFTLDVTEAFGRLYADRPLKPDEPLKVSIVARPLFPNRENAWKGTIQELTPKQVQLEIVRTTN